MLPCFRRLQSTITILVWCTVVKPLPLALSAVFLFVGAFRTFAINEMATKHSWMHPGSCVAPRDQQSTFFAEYCTTIRTSNGRHACDSVVASVFFTRNGRYHSPGRFTVCVVTAQVFQRLSLAIVLAHKVTCSYWSHLDRFREYPQMSFTTASDFCGLCWC